MTSTIEREFAESIAGGINFLSWVFYQCDGQWLSPEQVKPLVQESLFGKQDPLFWLRRWQSELSQDVVAFEVTEILKADPDRWENLELEEQAAIEFQPIKTLAEELSPILDAGSPVTTEDTLRAAWMLKDADKLRQMSHPNFQPLQLLAALLARHSSGGVLNREAARGLSELLKRPLPDQEARQSVEQILAGAVARMALAESYLGRPSELWRQDCIDLVTERDGPYSEITKQECFDWRECFRVIDALTSPVVSGESGEENSN